MSNIIKEWHSVAHLIDEIKVEESTSIIVISTKRVHLLTLSLEAAKSLLAKLPDAVKLAEEYDQKKRDAYCAAKEGR